MGVCNMTRQIRTEQQLVVSRHWSPAAVLAVSLCKIKRSPLYLGLSRICLVAALVTAALPAWAQQAPSALPNAATPADVTANVLAEPPWILYQKATLLLVGGDKQQASTLLAQLHAEYAGHPADHLAEPLRKVLERAESPANTSVPIDPMVELPSKAARAELVSTQTVGGINLGVQLCMAADCQSSRAVVLSIVGGAGTALGLSLWQTADGITPGTALAIDSAAMWGLYHSLMIPMISETQTNVNFNTVQPDYSRRDAMWRMAGQLGGTGLGIAAADHFQPHAGQVSMANSAGIWTGVATFLAMQSANSNVNSKTEQTAVLVASDLGLVAGAIGSTYFEVSRSRTIIIDTSGILGLLLGMGAVVLSQGDNVNSQALTSGALLGTLVGLGAGVALSANWDAPSLSHTAFVPTFAPMPGGGFAGIQGSF